jgi:hypothetical protein
MKLLAILVCKILAISGFVPLLQLIARRLALELEEQ